MINPQKKNNKNKKEPKLQKKCMSNQQLLRDIYTGSQIHICVDTFSNEIESFFSGD